MSHMLHCNGKPILRLLGGFEMFEDSRQILLPARKDRALVAYLALNAGRPQSREHLAALFWGDISDAGARRNLRHCLYTLRRALGADVASRLLVSGRSDVEWPVGVAAVDVHRLETLISERTSASMAEAAPLFRGPLLDGLTVGETAFDDWLDGQRRSVLRLLERMVEGLVESASQNGLAPLAIEAAEKLVAVDPLNEQARRLLMSAYAAGHRRSDAVRQYKDCVELLREELGVEPEKATTHLYLEIVSRSAHDDPASPRVKIEEPRRFKTELERSRPIADWPSIAVLPFSISGATPKETVLSLGLADELIELLYRYRWLRVIARASSFNYRSQNKDSQMVARDLDVRYVIHGTIQLWKTRIRCNIQVMDSTTGECVWANHIEQKISDIFALVDDLGRSIVGELEPALGRTERRRAMRQPADDLSTWSCYHRGVDHFFKFHRNDVEPAIRLLTHACRLEPQFSPAHAYLALAQQWTVMHGLAASGDSALENAHMAAAQAVELDPDSALARYARARIELYKNNLELASSDIRDVVTACPSFAGGHFALGCYYVRIGQYADAHSALSDAECLSPRDPELGYFHTLRARAYLAEQSYEKAKEWALRGLRVPNSNPWPILSTLVSALGHLGDKKEAALTLNDLERVTRRPRTVRLYRDLMARTMGKSFLEHFLEGLRRAGMPE